MGVVDNMLHKESSRMVSLNNGSNSEGRTGKSPTENGHCASRVGPPKYKQRRVSAVRDFPPGCGPLAPRILLTAREEAVSVRPAENSVGGNKSGDVLGVDSARPSGYVVESEPLLVLQSLVPSEMLKQTNYLDSKAEEQLVSSDQMDMHEPMNAKPAQIPLPVIEPVKALDSKAEEQLVSSDQVYTHEPMNAKPVQMQLPDIEPVKALDHGAFDVPKDLGQVDVAARKERIPPSSLKSWSPPSWPKAVSSGNGMEKTRNYPPRRTVSAVRDFPLFCGRNAQRFSKEECALVFASVKNISLGQEEYSIEDKSLKETVKTDVKPMGGDVLNGDEHKSKVELNVSRITGDKIQAESEWHSMKTMRKEDEFVMSPVSGMKVAWDDAREKSINTGNRDVRGLEEILRKDSVGYPEGKLLDTSGCENQSQEEDFEGLECGSDRAIVQGLMAAPNCPWSLRQAAFKPDLAGTKSESKGKQHDFILRVRPKSAIKKKNDFIFLKRPKVAVKTKKDEAENSGGTCFKKNSSPTGKVSEGMGRLVVWGKEDSLEYDEECENFYVGQRSHGLDVSLPPSCPVNSRVEGDYSDVGVTRNKVRETLRLFQVVCRKLLQEEEAKPSERRVRVDLQAARILKEKRKYVNTGKQIIGSVPGVEVGDEFQYRVELNIIGLHRQIQGGIDYVRQGEKALATSIVASGGYDDDLDNSDVLTYTGQGGNVMQGSKEPEDQKLERGNLALANSKLAKNPVRVIRGETKTSDSSDARGRTYIYDGLYLVDKFWQDMGQHGKLVFKFRLVRIPGQPELAWKVVNKSKKCKLREGICMDDISRGIELIPICAVNTIDNEKPPPFEYTTGVIYPDWCCPIPPKGCDCTSRCSESGRCSCVIKNGGEIPYNHNGAIVEAKPLVYECGPSCKCPPSCYNRVSQHGIRFQLEIFKTESRGWGVRSLNSIPSGNFICEYAGELLEDNEAERRTGNDEYLFDIGNNQNDGSLWNGLSTVMPDAQSSSHEVVGDGGFTIDAARFGNVGRFINHSCSPNLYAQNVLYDHDDRRIPHIMFFAAENIPPLQELTYHYNYMIDQVRDSNGNIKKKSCYCGSSECTGRMY